MARIRYVTEIGSVKGIASQDVAALSQVTDKYKFRANSYYLGLIDWSDPDDPIRRIIIPQVQELQDSGELDPCNEEANYVAPGCQHKYPHTAVLLCTEICGAYCRFCFRKRLFMNDNDEARVDLSPGIDYISRTPAITNVLLTGGDPLFLSTRRLGEILHRLREIPHVGIIRIGTKMPAFNPYRIIDDPALPETLSQFSHPHKRIYIMTHFNVAQELTDQARTALDILMRAGVVLTNQTPILHGINDRPRTLVELMRQLSFAGVPPYYFFQCRPTQGNKPFELPLVKAFQALEKAKSKVSGLAKRARLVMSHASGKIEMVGLDTTHIYLRYHRARDQKDEGRFMIFRRDDEAHWFDDLKPVHQPFRHHGIWLPGDFPPVSSD
jgi:lysine 2,3-aminomutase